MTAVFFLPVFYWIVLGIMSGFLLITGLTGIKYLKNTIMPPADIFLHATDMLSVKVLKLLCYLWEAVVLWLIYISVLSGDLWGVLAYLLLFFINAFYIIWFSSVLHMEKRRNDYSL